MCISSRDRAFSAGEPKLWQGERDRLMHGQKRGRRFPLDATQRHGICVAGLPLQLRQAACQRGQCVRHLPTRVHPANTGQPPLMRGWESGLMGEGGWRLLASTGNAPFHGTRPASSWQRRLRGETASPPANKHRRGHGRAYMDEEGSGRLRDAEYIFTHPRWSHAILCNEEISMAHTIVYPQVYTRARCTPCIVSCVPFLCCSSMEG